MRHYAPGAPPGGGTVPAGGGGPAATHEHAAAAPRQQQPGRVERAIDLLFSGIEGVLALLLVAMLAMVLGNVLLRYAFGTGIVVSEELSRLGLVWITFAGAVVAWRRGAHLGVDNLVQALPRAGRWVCALLAEALTVLCCVLVVIGTWQQHEVSLSTNSLVAGIPLIWMYGMGYVAGGGIGLLSLHKLLRLLAGGPRSVEDLPHETAQVVA